MKNDKFIPGLVLVLIGLAFLLDNFGYISFHWGNIFHLWPIFLIIAGVNLVFAHNNTPLAYIAKIGVIILGFGLLLFGNFGDRYSWPWYSYSWHDYNHNHNHNNNDSDDDDDDGDDTTGIKGIVKVDGVSNFNLPYTADAKTAELHISGGGTKYILNDTTNELFKADTKEHFGMYEFSHSNVGSNYILHFDMKGHHGGHFNWDTDDNGKSNAVTFMLNPSPVWSMYVETGATALDFDLTKYKIQKLKLSGGAASFKVKLGEPLASTDVEVSTGMASVEINIPQNAACEVETDSGLSSNNFNGFNKTNDGHYETPGFASAKNKIHINISGGISDFKVNRY
ncbi:MAG: LiaI-LiaF-like domain-containing protein [Sphingobacteriales bacterium]